MRAPRFHPIKFYYFQQSNQILQEKHNKKINNFELKFKKQLNLLIYKQMGDHGIAKQQKAKKNISKLNNKIKIAQNVSRTRQTTFFQTFKKQTKVCILVCFIFKKLVIEESIIAKSIIKMANNIIGQTFTWLFFGSTVAACYTIISVCLTICTYFDLIDFRQLWSNGQVIFGNGILWIIMVFFFRGGFHMLSVLSFAYVYFAINQVQKKLFNRNNYADFFYLCIFVITLTYFFNAIVNGEILKDQRQQLVYLWKIHVGSVLHSTLGGVYQAILDIINWFVRIVYNYQTSFYLTISQTFLMSLLYIRCKLLPNDSIEYFTIIPIKGSYGYLPIILYKVILFKQLWAQIIGILIGKIYILLKHDLTLKIHFDVLKTPAFFSKLVEYLRSIRHNLKNHGVQYEDNDNDQ